MPRGLMLTLAEATKLYLAGAKATLITLEERDRARELACHLGDELMQLRAVLGSDEFPCPGQHCTHGHAPTDCVECPDAPEDDEQAKRWECPSFVDRCPHPIRIELEWDSDDGYSSWSYPVARATDPGCERIAERLNEDDELPFWGACDERKRLLRVLEPSEEGRGGYWMSDTLNSGRVTIRAATLERLVMAARGSLVRLENQGASSGRLKAAIEEAERLLPNTCRRRGEVHSR